MKLLKIIFALVLFAAVAAAGLLFMFPRTALQPTSKVSVDIPRGTGTRGMAELLAANGVVISPWHFLAARVLRPSVTLQAGLYDFSKSATASEILDRIARGDVHFDELTIPEGSNIWDTADIASKLGWFSADDFLKATRDKAFVAELLPEVTPAPETFEGYLFPSTYRLTGHRTPRQIITQMTAEFHKVWMKLDAKIPIQEAVTLASLVEKETAVPDERPVVASVYRNRLDMGMLLGCDPTTIYAALLDGRYNGVIHRSDLDSQNPYNTYQHPGLPPGPIASPGEASLRAALQPANTKFLYFVARADGSGGHNFSANAAQHSRAVAQYRHAVAANK